MNVRNERGYRLIGGPMDGKCHSVFVPLGEEPPRCISFPILLPMPLDAQPDTPTDVTVANYVRSERSWPDGQRFFVYEYEEMKS